MGTGKIEDMKLKQWWIDFLKGTTIGFAIPIPGVSGGTMSTLGIMVGRFIGPLLGKRAEILGGIVLIGIGAQILWAHFAG